MSNFVPTIASNPSVCKGNAFSSKVTLQFYGFGGNANKILSPFHIHLQIDIDGLSLNCSRWILLVTVGWKSSCGKKVFRLPSVFLMSEWSCSIDIYKDQAIFKHVDICGLHHMTEVNNFNGSLQLLLAFRVRNIFCCQNLWLNCGRNNYCSRLVVFLEAKIVTGTCNLHVSTI